jgi:hypothetical protein
MHSTLDHRSVFEDSTRYQFKLIILFTHFWEGVLRRLLLRSRAGAAQHSTCDAAAGASPERAISAALSGHCQWFAHHYLSFTITPVIDTATAMMAQQQVSFACEHQQLF